MTHAMCPTDTRRVPPTVRTLRPSQPWDAAELAPRVRPEDRAELEASHGRTPFQALVLGYHISLTPMTALSEGKACGMFGVAPQEGAPGVGVIWLLGSKELTANRRWFLTASKAVLPQLIAPFSLVYNVVDARYTAAVSWLLWLGFTVATVHPEYGLGGLPFLEMEMEVATRGP